MQRRDLLSRLSLSYLGCLAAQPSLALEPPALWLANPYLGTEKSNHTKTQKPKWWGMRQVKANTPSAQALCG
jgi:hypothetical protein